MSAPLIKHNKNIEAAGALSVTAEASVASSEVKLPPGHDRREWIATHAVDFINRVCTHFATIEEHCTATSCPEMTAGNWEYRWQPEETTATSPKRPNSRAKRAKPISLPAHEYINKSLDWIEKQISDDAIFPTDP
jgi:MOB kinase activator 1